MKRKKCTKIVANRGSEGSWEPRSTGMAPNSTAKSSKSEPGGSLGASLAPLWIQGPIQKHNGSRSPSTAEAQGLLLGFCVCSGLGHACSSAAQRAVNNPSVEKRPCTDIQFIYHEYIPRTYPARVSYLTLMMHLMMDVLWMMYYAYPVQVSYVTLMMY